MALHCLNAYGVQLSSPRLAVHSLAGCFLYGAFVAKILLVRSKRLPGWALPVAGGTLVTVVVVLWYTAALWYFNGFRLAPPVTMAGDRGVGGGAASGAARAGQHRTDLGGDLDVLPGGDHE